MKNYLIILSIFITLEINNAQDYYQLNKSNQWVYSAGSFSKNISVNSDSLFQNGKIYSILSTEDFVYGKFVRADSQYVYYYDEYENREIPFFDLKGKVGDTTEVRFNDYSYVEITSIDSTEMFGEKVHTIKYVLVSLTITEVVLSDKFGLISVSYYDDPPPPWPLITYNLIGCVINKKTFGDLVSINKSNTLPKQSKLYQNYPNPFNPTTTIEYNISKNGFVNISIYNLLGEKIETLVNEYKTVGRHVKTFDGKNLSSGIYFYKISTKDKTEIKKMQLLK